MAKMQKIQVSTAPNGYELTVGTDEYFCYTREQLLESFFVRVGLGKSERMTRDTIANLMKSLGDYPTQMAAVGATESLQRKIDDLTRANESLNARIEKLQDSIATKITVIDELRRQAAVNLNRPKQKKHITKAEVL